MRKLNILVACEESQAITKILRKELNQNAFSCDLLKCSGGLPQYHFNTDVFEIIKDKGGLLQNGEFHQIIGNWDLMIAHPPCTYLAVSGARWYYDPKDKSKPHPRFPNRAKDREEAIDFFTKLWKCDIKNIVIENPIGIISTQPEIGKPTQIVQPWMFGDSATKTTCLWMRGEIKKLVPTNEVEKGERIYFASGKSQPKWYSDALVNSKSTEERRTLRSKTFPGMARAMATQWVEQILNQ
jgi:hypothetical protein